ncbi:MAG TPA: hypothetical protein VF915_04615, partial [Reyranella sp.]
ASMIDGDAYNLALVGGVDSLSRVQVGLGQRLSDWLRKFQQARSLGQKLDHVTHVQLKDIKLYIPAIANRTTGLSMGEHTEITAKEWQIGRQEQDETALQSHQQAVAGWDEGFFDDLVIPLGDVKRDTIPRKDTSLEKLARLPPSFDRTSGMGTLTAGNSSPLTDGAAAIWVASSKGLGRLPSSIPRVKLVDWEIASVDFRVEGLLMAPAFAIPRLLARHDLTYGDIHLWEIHEAFAAQVAFHLKALQDPAFLRDKAKVPRDFGTFPKERMNPNGGSTAIGHPFGAHGRAHHQPGGEGACRHAQGKPCHRQHLRRRRPGQRHAARSSLIGALRRPGGLGNDLERQDLDLAAGHEAGLFGVVLEPVTLLQVLGRLVVGSAGEMVVVSVLGVLHAAIGDAPLQDGIAVEVGDEPGDLAVPILLRARGEPVLDEELLHRLLLRSMVGIGHLRAKERSRKYGQK